MKPSLSSLWPCFLLSVAIGCSKGGDAPSSSAGARKQTTSDAGEKEQIVQSNHKEWGVDSFSKGPLPILSDRAYMQQCGIAYLNHVDAKGIGPSNADDLVAYLGNLEGLLQRERPLETAGRLHAAYLENLERLLQLLRSGDYVLIWDMKLPDHKNGYKGAGDLVLGYIKNVPTKGGPVLMGDGKVVQMTADEFKKAKMATPAPKP